MTTPNISGHNVTVDNFSIVGREDHNIKRAIKEALYIRSNNPIPEQDHRQIPSATYLG